MAESDLVFGILPVNAPVTQGWAENGHRGIDYGVNVGTHVLAPAGGDVVPFTNDGSFGIALCISHPGTGLYSLYAHLAGANAVIGNIVVQGDLLGYSGNTGYSTGPHLHWQVCTTPAFPVDISYSRDPMSFYHPEEDDDMTPEDQALLYNLARRVLCGAEYGPMNDIDALITARGEAARWASKQSVGDVAASAMVVAQEHTHPATPPSWGTFATAAFARNTFLVPPPPLAPDPDE